MSKILTKITDDALKRKIETSVLAEDQKKELIALMPQMTDKERDELIEMINTSIKEIVAADPKLQKRVQVLNEEYEHKLNDLMHEQSHAIRESFEKLEQTETGKAVEALEGEIEGMDQNSAGNASSKKSDSSVKTSHTVRRFAMLFVALIVFATLILIGLNYL